MASAWGRVLHFIHFIHSNQLNFNVWNNRRRKSFNPIFYRWNARIGGALNEIANFLNWTFFYKIFCQRITTIWCGSLGRQDRDRIDLVEHHHQKSHNGIENEFCSFQKSRTAAEMGRIRDQPGTGVGPTGLEADPVLGRMRLPVGLRRRRQGRSRQTHFSRSRYRYAQCRRTDRPSPGRRIDQFRPVLRWHLLCSFSFDFVFHRCVVVDRRLTREVEYDDDIQYLSSYQLLTN